MKVKFEIEIDVDLSPELTPREMRSALGVLQRNMMNRLQAFVGSRLGGEVSPSGWEPMVKSLEIKLGSKV